MPEALASLAGVPTRHSFERTAGDEFQGVLDDPATLASVVERLLRSGAWHIGIGTGAAEVDGDSARAGRGAAHVAAREAVTAAKRSPSHLRVCGDHPLARDLESALWLWAWVLDRRSDRGWEVVDLIEEGATHDEAARTLGISQSAVTQRAGAAALTEGRRGRELVEHLAALEEAVPV